MKEAQDQASKAAQTLQEIMNIPDGGIPQTILDHAECIAVFPSVIKAGFIFGGRGGKGLVSCRGSKTGSWGPPLYLKIGGGSFGLQIGVEATDLILIVMNQRAGELFTHDRFELGGEGSVSAGPVGRTAAAETDLPTLRSEILSYSRSRGAFAGLEIKGSVITRDTDLNHAVYGQNLRALNMLYEGLKENATIVIVPSTVVETMQLGGIAGVTALTMGLGQERPNKEKESELRKQE